MLMTTDQRINSFANQRSLLWRALVPLKEVQDKEQSEEISDAMELIKLQIENLSIQISELQSQ